jgi:hypothetical protein
MRVKMFAQYFFHKHLVTLIEIIKESSKIIDRHTVLTLVLPCVPADAGCFNQAQPCR